jgi:flagellar hook-associated protein 3 FlgL
MTDRITPSMVAASTLTDLSSALSQLQRSTNELSSGRSILEPSDNPYGASRVIDLQSQLDGLTSYESNAQNGISWTSTADSSMASMNSSLQRVRELVLAAANGTSNQQDMETIAGQVEQLTEGIKQDANAQFAGEYIFSGTAATTPPYEQGAGDEYQGNAETVSRAVGPGASVVISTNISTLLGNGKEAEDGKLLDTLRTIAANLRSGVPAQIKEVATTNLKSLDANMETLTDLQASAGAASDQLQAALSRNEDLQSTITETLSNTQDANIAQVSVDFANEQAAYQAALRASASIIQESLINFLQ